MKNKINFLTCCKDVDKSKRTIAIHKLQEVTNSVNIAKY